MIDKQSGVLKIKEFIVNVVKRNSINLDITQAIIDTVTILDKFYSNVYIWENLSNETDNIGVVYFAKQYGFLRIEQNDGRKVELIN
jgi:hypothetical protein